MSRDPNLTPWDVYVDERKDGDYCLGYLLVPNTASFNRKLFLSRNRRTQGTGSVVETREIHWNKLHRGVLDVAIKWIDIFFQHRGTKYYLGNWQRGDSKEIPILWFLSKLVANKRLDPPYNVVTFLDYDSEHSRSNVQNRIREIGRIARCYHVVSTKNDCVQCCDLLLGAYHRVQTDPEVLNELDELQEKRADGQKLRDSESKRLVAAYLGSMLDENDGMMYDLRES